MRITIKKALISGVILLQFVTLTTLLVSSYISNQRSFNSHAHKLMIDYADNVINNSKRFLDTAAATTLLSSELLSSDVLSIDRPEDLALYFFQQLKQSPHISGIYFANTSGTFVHVQREQGFNEPLFSRKSIIVDTKNILKSSHLYTHNNNFTQLSVKEITKETYDPRDRIWFNKALDNDALSWTDPYVFFSSRKPGITSSMPVYDEDNQLIGVVGVDLSLATISSFFDNLDLGENSTAFVTNRLGEIIAYPDQKIIQDTANESLRFPRINEINNPIALTAWQALQEKTQLFSTGSTATTVTFNYDNNKYHGLFKEFTHHKWPWIIAIYMPEKFFLNELIDNQKLNILFGLVISIIACLTSFFFINHITDSLRKIKVIAENIRCGQFIKTNISESTFVELQQMQYAFNNMIDSLITSRKENEQLHLMLEKTNAETITRLGLATEYKNDSSPNHIRRVSRYCEVIALNMGMPKDKAKELRAAAKLHDLGKIGIPEQILSKPAALTMQEWAVMKTAPTIGAKILQDAESATLKVAHDIALTLHEHWDGRGYPNQLHYNDIPLSARIVAVVDTFYTMIHPRCYKKAIPIEIAINKVRALSGSKFDPSVIAAFDHCLMDILNIYKQLSPSIEVHQLPRRCQ
nr:HD domain-containing phosphohydrolase [Moritella viscosa]SHO11704.1 Response regulator [Moritella viscosa]